jgi:iron-sulfur cluster assembly accessory protein
MEPSPACRRVGRVRRASVHRNIPQLTRGARIPNYPDMSDVTISESAARRIGQILKTEPAGAMLRVSVEGGGCSGFQYKFGIERAKGDDDLVLARDGAVVLIDPVSVNYMAGSQIDFVDDLIGQSFKINNPQATASCGCGTSFSI